MVASPVYCGQVVGPPNRAIKRSIIRNALPPRHRVALVGLGMAVTPHAQSLRDLSDRVEVAGAYSPTPGRRTRFRSALRFSGDRRSRCAGRRSVDRCGADPDAAAHASAAGRTLCRRRQARAAREAARSGHRRAPKRSLPPASAPASRSASCCSIVSALPRARSRNDCATANWAKSRRHRSMYRGGGRRRITTSPGAARWRATAAAC